MVWVILGPLGTFIGEAYNLHSGKFDVVTGDLVGGSCTLKRYPVRLNEQPMPSASVLAAVVYHC